MTLLKKIGKIILYLFLTIFVIILIGVGIVWGYQKYKHYQLGKELEELPIDEELSYESILHDHMDETIGDNKMTVSEKLDLKLNPYIIDTSGNGLSDSEAVNKYDLDPKAFSTAEDGISDYVKIKEGMDPKKKINSKDIEEFTIENEDLGTKLETNDLNAKYYSSIEAYDHDELNDIYQPVRDPIRIRNYDGEAFVEMPDGKDKSISAYYFNFDHNKMEKIKKQKWTDDGMMMTINKDFPIYFFNDDVLDDFGDYYYFRLSLFDFSRAIAGYDHKLFIFKRGIFTDELFKDESFEDPDYGIIEISQAKISYVYALALEGIYRTLDLIFQPLEETDGDIFVRALFDYGKVEGTPESVQRYVMPWLYEDEELETENENSYKVVDSGFRLKHHAFRFGNMRTEIGNEGVCAGISRTTEFLYNDKELETKLQYKPEKWRTKIYNKLNDNIYSTLKYDITDKENDYPFLSDGELFDYTFTDDTIRYLTEDTYVDADLTIKPEKLSQPDQSLIKLLETQWMYSNEQKYKNRPSYPIDISILDKVEKYLEDGQIIYASLNKQGGGHTVSIYKMEYDRYDDDLIRFYVYDPNLPYEKLTDTFGKKEVYMEVHMKKGFITKETDGYKYFDFDYTPFESHRDSYSYSTDNGYSMLLYHNDDPINGN